MSFLGGGTTQAQKTPDLTGIKVQTAVFGRAIPIAYGATRLAANLIGYTNFRQHKGSGGSKGGKGGGGGGKGAGKGGTNQTTYSADILLAICEGPITGFGVLYQNQGTTNTGSVFGEFTGTYPQAALPGTNFFDNLGYSGIAAVAATNYPLGASATLPNFNFEVFGRLFGTAPSGYGGNVNVPSGEVQSIGGVDALGGDADASLVAVDLLTNPFYGAGFPGSRLGTVANSGEAQTIPSAGPFTVQLAAVATNNWSLLYNLAVNYTSGPKNGQLLTCVSGAPGPGQYAVNAATGIYTFNAADAGQGVDIFFAALLPNNALIQFQLYCLASGLWISPAYTEATSTSSILDDLAKNLNAEWVWSSGVLTIVPRGAQSDHRQWADLHPARRAAVQPHHRRLPPEQQRNRRVGCAQ